LLVARCEVFYTGRLTARLPEAVLLMFKADGSFLVHDDAGGYRPLNWGLLISARELTTS
jgi:RecB family endonuclease NucS